jgi:hypothetical protein
MIALYVLFAVVMVLCALLCLTLVAAAATAGIFFIAPWLAQSWLAYRLRAPRLRLPRYTPAARPQPPTTVLLARRPLTRQAVYLTGHAHGSPTWGHRKQARTLHLEDKLAIRAWIYWVERRGGGADDVFVVYAEAGK